MDKEQTMTGSDHDRIHYFLDQVVELCLLYGMEFNGCFSVGTTDTEDTDGTSIRNIEHISKEGVVRTLSRGNRL